MSDEPNRRVWKKILVPDAVLDMFAIVAKSQGYTEREWYLFLYLLLMKSFPNEVEKLADILDTRQFEPPDEK